VSTALDQVVIGTDFYFLIVPAFCVWELVPVWHEQQAWKRFLESARDEAAARQETFPRGVR